MRMFKEEAELKMQGAPETSASTVLPEVALGATVSSFLFITKYNQLSHNTRSHDTITNISS